MGEVFSDASAREEKTLDAFDTYVCVAFGLKNAFDSVTAAARNAPLRVGWVAASLGAACAARQAGEAIVGD